VLRELGLTHALANAVWLLDPDSNAPSMRELAGMLKCDPSTVTALADRLEQRDLVTRNVDPGNRRTKTLALTGKGRIVRDQLVSAMSTRSPIARLSKSEQRQLLTLLSKTLGHTAGREPA